MLAENKKWFKTVLKNVTIQYSVIIIHRNTVQLILKTPFYTYFPTHLSVLFHETCKTSYTPEEKKPHQHLNPTMKIQGRLSTYFHSHDMYIVHLLCC
jgi:hypothetical protein